MLAHRSSESAAEQQLKTTTAEDKSRFVYFDLDVKSWEKSPPAVEACRPAQCPCCGVPSVSSDGRVILRGHGLRVRQRWGPADAEPTSAGEVRTVEQRRYRCRACRAVITVRPRGELAHRRYTASAIVLALWLWGCGGLDDAAVQSRSSPFAARGMSRPERWTTLRRWARAAGDGTLWRCVHGEPSWTLRQCAERAARVIAALADVAIGPPASRAFAGVVHAR